MSEKKLKPLVFSLLVSGCLNVALLAGLIASLLYSSPQTKAAAKHQPSIALKPTNQSLLTTYSKMSYRELTTLLTNRDLVEEGYLKRDLALAALVTYHHFNLEKALSSNELQRRMVGEVELFPALSDDQFEAILRFAYQDKWPFTAKGLFELLKKSTAPRDTTLESAFCMSAEFHALEALFQKTNAAINTTDLLSLALDAPYELLSQFNKEQAQLLDHSLERRRRLLLSYLIHESKAAAELLIKTDFDFVLKKLDDPAIFNLTQLLQTPNAENVRFCKALLETSRSDRVWEGAVKKLYQFAHEPIPDPFSLQTALLRFRGTTKKVASASIEKPKAARYHIVQEKESLWKIAKQYHVKVEDIVQLNGIEKDKLRPGMELKIPD